MGKVINLSMFIVLVSLSCHNENKVNKSDVNKKVHIKTYNIDSIGHLKVSELNGCYLFKLFPNGDTNFIYLLKGINATSVVAWDTNGVKTLENNKGVWKSYEDNILTDEIYQYGKSDEYTMISYYPSGKKWYQSQWKNYKPIEIIKFNENGDTIHYERPKQIKKSKKEKN